jgi:hypothetical protein
VEGCYVEGCYVEGCYVEGCYVEGCYVEGRFVEGRFVVVPFSPAFIVDPRHPAVMLNGIFCPPTSTVFNKDGIGRWDNGLKKWFKSLLTYIYIFLHYLVHNLNA